ncbi:MAG: hypothetical protein ACOYLM_10925 [Methylococcaceae bacterium]
MMTQTPRVAFSQNLGEMLNLLQYRIDSVLINEDVQGANFYVSDKNPGLIVGSSVYRIVCGGTGKYFGARGEVVSTRLPDGSYKHVFKLMR